MLLLQTGGFEAAPRGGCGEASVSWRVRGIMMELLFLVDRRYSDLDAVRSEVVRLLGLPFEERDSDYLGGRYLIWRGPNGTTVRIKKNYSAFLGEQQVECSEDAGVYIIVVSGKFEPNPFLQLGILPGVVLHRTHGISLPGGGG